MELQTFPAFLQELLMWTLFTTLGQLVAGITWLEGLWMLCDQEVFHMVCATCTVDEEQSCVSIIAVDIFVQVTGLLCKATPRHLSLVSGRHPTSIFRRQTWRDY